VNIAKISSRFSIGTKQISHRIYLCNAVCFWCAVARRNCVFSSTGSSKILRSPVTKKSFICILLFIDGIVFLINKWKVLSDLEKSVCICICIYY